MGELKKMIVAEALLALLVFGLIIGFMPVAQANPYTVDILVYGTNEWGDVALSFSGAYGDASFMRSVDGIGRGLYTIVDPSGDIVSAVFQKMEEKGTLYVQIIKNGVMVESQSTTAAYGVVAVSHHFVEEIEEPIVEEVEEPIVSPPTLPSIPPVEYVEFIAISLEIVPSQVIVGDEVEIIVNARNIGNIEGTDTLRLYLNNVLMQPENGEHLTLAPGENGVVIFTVTPLFTSPIDVKIGGQYGSFTVIAPPQEPTPTPTTEPLIGLGVTGGIIAVAVIISVTVFYARRGRTVAKLKK